MDYSFLGNGTILKRKIDEYVDYCKDFILIPNPVHPGGMTHAALSDHEQNSGHSGRFLVLVSMLYTGIRHGLNDCS